MPLIFRYSDSRDGSIIFIFLSFRGSEWSDEVCAVAHRLATVFLCASFGSRLDMHACIFHFIFVVGMSLISLAMIAQVVLAIYALQNKLRSADSTGCPYPLLDTGTAMSADFFFFEYSGGGASHCFKSTRSAPLSIL